MPENELAVLDEATLAELKQYAGAGKDMIEEEITPRLILCQPNSPEVTKDEIARAGELVIKPIGKNVGKTFCFVMIASTIRWVRWKHRDEGGGIIWQGKYSELTDAQKEECKWPPKGEKFPVAEGDDMQARTKKERGQPIATETRTFLVIEYDPTTHKVDPNGYGPLICDMKGSSAPVGKDINTKVKFFGGDDLPIFALVVEVGTERRENENIYFVYTAKSAGPISKENGKQLNDMFGQFKGLISRAGTNADEQE